MLPGVDPRPVAIGEQLPAPVFGRHLLCPACRVGLLYQRQERPRYPRHFVWCRRCGARYAFGGEHWTPAGMGTVHG